MKQGVYLLDGEDAGLASWKVLRASVTGRSHSAIEKENEDAVHSATLADGALLLALADGAGSASHAGTGARQAVVTAIEALREANDAGRPVEQALRDALRKVRREVAKRSRQARIRPRCFASTLLLVVAHRGLLATLQVGDGAAVALGENGWERLTAPIRGRHAGETVFVTSREAAALAEIDRRSLEGVRALALLSDGLEPVATDVETGLPHAPFFDPLVAFASAERLVAEQEAELEDFLASDRLQSRSPDDMSLIVAVRR